LSTESNVTMIEVCRPKGSSFSERVKALVLARRGEPLFLSDGDKVVMFRFEVGPDFLQHEVPFPLDYCEGRALVTLVAFPMRRMQPRQGGMLSQLLFLPLAAHHFLNVRIYVTFDGEPGIHFLAE
jgi:uncharacterized protein YqjF (DUF2071 family)